MQERRTSYGIALINVGRLFAKKCIKKETQKWKKE
jgi:hypothetical protein